MRVAIIGAGNVGVAQAYELAVDGHTVTVYEQRGSVAAEASFAHPGLSMPGGAMPWSAGGVAPPGWLSLLNPKATAHVARSLAAWRWTLRMRRAVKAKHANELLARHVRLQDFSQQRLQAITQRLKLEHEHLTGGLLLARDAASAERLKQRLAALTALGVRAEWADADQCRSVEPGLNADHELLGGVVLPHAEVSNARQFALLLRNEAQRLGVRFEMHCAVQHIETGKPLRITHLTASSPESTLVTPSSEDGTGNDDAEPITESFDAIVICGGLGSGSLLANLGLKVPLMAVHGWALTAALRHHEAHPDAGPRAAVVDEARQVLICRIGNRVRVSGGARIGGVARSGELPAALYRALDDWFPGTAHMSQAQRWTGARAMLPDGLPAIGASGIPGVWINTGHGHSGWALATGAARLVADGLGQRLPSIDPSGLEPERWRR